MFSNTYYNCFSAFSHLPGLLQFMNLPSLDRCNQIAAWVLFYFYLDTSVTISHLHMNGIRTEMYFHSVRAFNILSFLLLPFIVNHFAFCL